VVFWCDLFSGFLGILISPLPFTIPIAIGNRILARVSRYAAIPLNLTTET